MTTVTVQLSVQFDMPQKPEDLNLVNIGDQLDKINDYMSDMGCNPQLFTGAVEMDYVTLKSEDDE